MVINRILGYLASENWFLTLEKKQLKNCQLQASWSLAYTLYAL